MTNTKMTNAEKFAMVIEFVKGNEVDFTQVEMVEFLEGRKAQAEKANAPRKANGKPTKAQIENAEIAEKVKAHLEEISEVGVTTIFDMKALFNDIGIEQLGKAVSVTKILVEQGKIVPVGKIDSKEVNASGKPYKREGYSFSKQ